MKFIGGGLILICSFLHTYEFRLRLKRAISDLRTYYDLVEHVRMQIEYFALPISKILADYDGAEAKTVPDILESLESNDSLSSEEKKVISEWISHLGDGYKDEQLTRCGYAKEKLGQFLEKRTRDYPAKVKVNNALSFLGGASLILLLM